LPKFLPTIHQKAHLPRLLKERLIYLGHRASGDRSQMKEGGWSLVLGKGFRLIGGFLLSPQSYRRA